MQAVIHLIAKSTAFNSLVVYIKIVKWWRVQEHSGILSCNLDK